PAGLLVDIKFPNPTNAVGGSFTLCLHEQPAGLLVEIKFPNPTNAVGGSFRLNLHEQPAGLLVDIKYPNPTNPLGGSVTLNLHEQPAGLPFLETPISPIPPTELVDRSGSAYERTSPAPVSRKFQSPQSHQRSWWISQALPTSARPRLPFLETP